MALRAVAGGGGGTPGGSSGQIQYNNSGAFGGVSGSSVSANGSLTLGGATVTANDPVLNLTQTWNSSGVTFTGLKLYATDTASAAGSLLADLGVGSTSMFSVSKAGKVTVTAAQSTASGIFASDSSTTGISMSNGGGNQEVRVWLNGSLAARARTTSNNNGGFCVSGLGLGNSADASNPTAMIYNNAGTVEINNCTVGTYRDLKLRGVIHGSTYTVATLPTASTVDGGVFYVSDATATTNGSAPSGGGSNKVLVKSNGTAYVILG